MANTDEIYTDYGIDYKNEESEAEKPHQSKVHEIRNDILVAAHNYKDIEDRIKILESNVENISNDELKIRQYLHEYSVQQREAERAIEDIMLNTQRECENQLANQHKDSERHNIQIQNRITDHNSQKTEVIPQISDLVYLRNEKYSLKKRKVEQEAIRKDAEEKYSSVKSELERRYQRKSEISKVQDEIKYCMTCVNKVSEGLRSTITSKTKIIQNFKEQIESIKHENARLFVIVENSKLSAEKNQDTNAQAENNEIDHIDNEVTRKKGIIHDLNQNISSAYDRKQKISDAILNYEKAQVLWKEIEVQLMTAKSELENLNRNESKYVDECDI